MLCPLQVGQIGSTQVFVKIRKPVTF